MPAKSARLDKPESFADKRCLASVNAGDKLKVGLFVLDSTVYVDLYNPVKNARICLDPDTMDSVRMCMKMVKDKTHCEYAVGSTEMGTIYVRRELFKNSWLTHIRVYSEDFKGLLVATRRGVSMVDKTWRAFESSLDDICK